MRQSETRVEMIIYLFIYLFARHNQQMIIGETLFQWSACNNNQ